VRGVTVVLVSYGATEQVARAFLPPAVAMCHGRAGRTYRIYRNVDQLPSYYDTDGAPILTAHSFETVEQAKQWVEQQNLEIES
jgi:predicted ATP-grasp superfamily ATP-dependent carboligase